MRILSLISLVFGLAAAIVVAFHIRVVATNIPYALESPYRSSGTMLRDLEQETDLKTLRMAATTYLRMSDVSTNYMNRYVVLSYFLVAALSLSLLVIAYLASRLASNNSFKPNPLRGLGGVPQIVTPPWPQIGPA